MKTTSSAEQYKDMFLMPTANGSFDLSVFKETGLKHAANAHSGSHDFPGDVMRELAELIRPSHGADLDATRDHGHNSFHGSSIVDDLGAALKGGGAGSKGGGKGHGGSSTDGGGTTSGGSTTSGGGTTSGGTTTGGGTTSGGTTTGGGAVTGDTSSPPPGYVIADLSSGYSWGHAPITVKYAFLDALPTYYSSSSTEAHNFSIFNLTQENAARSVLAQLSSLINVTFQETTDANSQIAFGNAALGSGIAAWTYYPYSTGTYNQAGDVWVNNQYSFNFSPSPGNFAYLTLLHEIGHAMGLKHSFEGTNSLPAAEDNRMFTDMSYSTDPLMPGVEPQTYMLYDIAALQSLYGANTATASGNTAYDFTGANNLLETIWDAGGIDTFNCSGLTSSVTLNLNGGSFSSIGMLGGTSSAQNNVAIAYNCTIENATGGGANDIIIGNYANNVISGGGGNDVLTGAAGADTFVFTRGSGQDTITDFQHGTDVINFAGMGATQADVHITDGAAGAVVQVADVAITLTGVHASQIDSHDFLFS